MLASPHEEVFLDAHRHGVVLARPLSWALGLGLASVCLLRLGWPATPAAALLAAVAAVLALRAVWRWERTRIVVTTEKLFLVQGTLRRRASAVRLARVPTVEIEQTLTGRVLGYGTVIAGDLEITYVARPRDVYELVAGAG